MSRLGSASEPAIEEAALLELSTMRAESAAIGVAAPVIEVSVSESESDVPAEEEELEDATLFPMRKTRVGCANHGRAPITARAG